MSASTTLQVIKKARQSHYCSWCPEPIEVGAEYYRYRYFSYSSAGTVKLHPECHKAMSESIDQNEEFYPGETPRGCSCGFTVDCENCAALNNDWHKKQEARKLEYATMQSQDK